MADTCEVTLVAHTPTRQIEGFSKCGLPATHRYHDDGYAWFSCAGHAQATWDVLEEDEGTMEEISG